MTLETALIGALTTLAGVVVFLFKAQVQAMRDHMKALADQAASVEARATNCERRVEECDEDRRRIWEWIDSNHGNTCSVKECSLRKPLHVPYRLYQHAESDG